MTLPNHDVCTRCGEMALPRFQPGSIANAVMCQNCGWVFQRGENVDQSRDTKTNTAAE